LPENFEMNALLSRIRARKAELLAQAKTKGTFVVSDEDRVKALEALLARQRAGSPAPGDAEKIRAIEALVDQQKAKKAAPGPVASAVVQRTARPITRSIMGPCLPNQGASIRTPC
jgi:hypothetical protein